MSTQTLATRLGLKQPGQIGSADPAFANRRKLALKFLTRTNLTEFQRRFLQTMTTQAKLSSRQEEIWRDLLARCGR